MAEPALDLWLRQLRGFLHADQARTLTDAELVRRFATERDELAFGVLLERHGPLVLGVCRRMLGGGPDAEDAFQATFVVLVRKAKDLTQYGCLANWLYAVAVRVANKARVRVGKQHGRERTLEHAPEPATNAVLPDEVREVLDQELAALPSKYRLPLVLCSLEGHSLANAAEQLGWPIGTVSGRMARGREMLSKRLAKRGLTVPTLALVGYLTSESTAAPLAVATLHSVQQTPTANIARLADAVLQNTVAKRVTLAASVCLAFAVGGLVWAGSGEPKKNDVPPAKTEKAEPRSPIIAKLGTPTLRHADLTNVVPSADGKLFASAGADGVFLWDRVQGELVRRFETRGERILEVALAPDGTSVAGRGKFIHVWDIATGQERFAVPCNPDDRHEHLTFTPKSDAVVLIEEKSRRQWDTQTGKERPAKHEPFRAAGAIVHNIPTNRLMYLNCNSPLYLIDLDTGTERTLLHEPKRHLSSAVCFAGDGRTFAAALDASVRLVDAATGAVIRTIPTELTEAPRKLALSQDGQTLAVLGVHASGKKERIPANRLLVFDTTTGKQTQSITLTGGPTDDPALPSNIALTPDGKTLLGWDSSTIYVWDTPTGKRLHQPTSQHRMTDVQPSRTSHIVATISDGSSVVRVWDTTTGKQRLAVRGKKPSLSPDGNTLALVGEQGTDVQLWDIATGKQIRSWAPHPDNKNGREFVGRVVFLNDGERLLTIGSDGIYGLGGKVAFWSLKDGKELQRFGPVGDVMAWSADGSRLLTRNPEYATVRYNRLYVWDTATGKETDAADGLQGVKIVPRDPGMLSPDGQWLAVADNNTETLGIWSMTTGKLVHSLMKVEYGSNVAWSGDGKYLATSRQLTDVVQVWDVATGKELVRHATGQGFWPRVALNHDASQLITVGADTTLIVWDIAALQKK